MDVPDYARDSEFAGASTVAHEFAGASTVAHEFAGGSTCAHEFAGGSTGAHEFAGVSTDALVCVGAGRGAEPRSGEPPSHATSEAARPSGTDLLAGVSTELTRLICERITRTAFPAILCMPAGSHVSLMTLTDVDAVTSMVTMEPRYRVFAVNTSCLQQQCADLLLRDNGRACDFVVTFHYIITQKAVMQWRVGIHAPPMSPHDLLAIARAFGNNYGQSSPACATFVWRGELRHLLRANLAMSPSAPAHIDDGGFPLVALAARTRVLVFNVPRQKIHYWHRVNGVNVLMSTPSAQYVVSTLNTPVFHSRISNIVVRNADATCPFVCLYRHNLNVGKKRLEWTVRLIPVTISMSDLGVIASQFINYKTTVSHIEFTYYGCIDLLLTPMAASVHTAAHAAAPTNENEQWRAPAPTSEDEPH